MRQRDTNNVIVCVAPANLYFTKPQELKKLSRYASLNHNIYIAADPTPGDVEHAAHWGHCIVGPQCLFSDS